jgi:hypothetical protein
MSEDKKQEHATWAVLYRDMAGKLQLIECYTEREAMNVARRVGGTYQMVDK